MNHRANHLANHHARPYRDRADLARMRELLIVGSQARIPASYAHPGFIDLDLHWPPDEEADRRNLLLWEYTGEGAPALEAWAIFSRLEATFDLFVHPAVHGTPRHATIMDEYVAWAEGRAGEAGQKQIAPFWAMAYDTVLAALMRERGFVIEEVDPPPPLFERTLNALPPVTLPPVNLPEGFTVQGVQNLEDGLLRAQITFGAFRPDGDWESYWHNSAQLIGSAVYEGERDLFVRAPDGRGAAACTVWFDPVNKVGLFEPVATHPDFQRLGLGKAVMAEGMRRMKAAGMQRAVLGFDPNNVAARALYFSMGFRASAYFLVAHKEV